MTTDAEKFEAERQRRQAHHKLIVHALQNGLPGSIRIKAPYAGRLVDTSVEIDFGDLALLVEKATLNKSRQSRAGAFRIKVTI